ncbi:unnamed protein product [Adineta ricciae]|uniref:Uncharacterized protein n=1 Tax=Adineta ricciae TaxID=249248 RepID=A0A814LB08_ADIRI|nr:unnamed protein product [Adineta ricciae]
MEFQKHNEDSNDSFDTESSGSRSSGSSSEFGEISNEKRNIRSVLSMKIDETNDFTKQTRLLHRQKRLFKNSFDPDAIIRSALKSFESQLVKAVENLNLKSIFEQVLRLLDIPSIIQKSFGDLNKIIEKQLDIPNILTKELKKINIEPFLKEIIAQLDFISVVKDQMKNLNFETTFNDLIKQIDLKKVINEQIKNLNMTSVIDNIIQLGHIDETIQSFISKIDPMKIFQQTFHSIDVDQLFDKFIDFNNSISPWKRLFKLLKLDEIQNPEWILQQILPGMDSQGIYRLIDDFRNTLEAVGNGTLKTKDIMVNFVLDKGIPFIIDTFKSQGIKVEQFTQINRMEHPLPLITNNETQSSLSTTGDEDLTYESTLSTENNTQWFNSDELMTINQNESIQIRKKRDNLLYDVIIPKPSQNRVLRLLRNIIQSSNIVNKIFYELINWFYFKIDMDLCW